MKLNLKRFLAYLLAALMLVSIVPTSAIAEITAASNTSASIRSIMPDQGVYVTFEFYVDDSLYDTQIVKNGEGSVTAPKTPETEAGQKFEGWYVGNVPFNFGPVTGYTSTQTVRVDARYTGVYYVFFKDNNGRIVATKEGKADDVISTADVSFPVKANESITGWYTDEARTNKVDSVTLKDKNVTLYAKVEVGYWITYDSKGGSYIQPKFYGKGATASAPTDPTRPGYTFSGWFTDEELNTEAVFGAISQNTTVYAKWTAADGTQYTVIHFWENADDDGYSYKESETKSGTTGAQTNATAKNYQGFTAQTITQTTIAADGSTIVSVYYKRNVYDVKFYEKSGRDWSENTSLRITAKYGANISKQWPGGGWYVSQNGSTAQSNIDVMPLNGTNFYGKQDGRYTHTAYYYVEVLPGESGTNVGGKTYKLDHKDVAYSDDRLTVTNEDRYPITGFTVNTQWSTKNRNNYDGAKFYYDRNSYDVIYINSGSKVHNATFKYGQNISSAGDYKLTTPPAGMEGYTFAGWYADEGLDVPYDFNGKTMPAQNITVYAKWVPPVHTVTVYDAAGEELKKIEKIPHGDKIREDQMPEVTLAEGEVFLGWVLKDGTPFHFDTEIKKDYSIYAKVGSTAQFTVTYDANAEGATGSVTDDNTYGKGAFADVKANGFTNSGKVFLYWNTAADGSGTKYYPNDKIEMTGNVTLYAIWGTPGETVTLTYHSNFGEGESKTTEPTVVNGKVTILGYSETELPSRPGYTFTGWNTAADGTGTRFAAGDAARLDANGNNDLFAQWTANDQDYKVEFYYEQTDGTFTRNAIDTRSAKTDEPVSVTETDKAQTESGKYVFDEGNLNNVLSDTIPATGTLVLKLYFKLNTAKYTIHHYLKGTTVQVADDQTGTMTIGQTLTANKSDSLYTAYASAAVVDSYAPSQSITITAIGNEIIVYYTVPLTIQADNGTKTYDGTPLTKGTFAVEGLVNGDAEGKFTLNMTAESTITNVGTQPNVINPATVKYNGGVIPSYYTVTYTPGTLTITQNETELKVIANSNSWTYDGNEHSDGGYTVEFGTEKHTVEVGKSATLSTGDTVTATITKKVKNVSDSQKDNNVIIELVVTNENQYKKITKMPGTLTITPVTDEVVVKIVGNTDTKTYDGTQKSVAGYTVSINNDLYKETDFTFTGSATATGTDVGEYLMGLNEELFRNTSTNFTNVKFVVTDGKLTINKREIELTANSATKEYDGTALTDGGYTITNGTFVTGEGLESVTVEGSQTLVGTSANTITAHQLKANTKAENYAITYKSGTLTVTDRTNPYEITVVANSGEKVYDGKPLTVEGFETLEFTVNGQKYTVEGLTASKTGTNVSDSGAVTVTGTAVVKDANGNDVTGQFTVKTVNGTLTITPFAITITAKDNTVEYDGQPHGENGYVATATVEGETIDSVQISGSRTDAGKYENLLDPKDAKIVDAQGNDVTKNYVITYVSGTLTINPKAVTITAESASKVYDGTALTQPEFTVSELEKGDTHKFKVEMTAESTITNFGTQDNVIATVDGEAVTTGTENRIGNYLVTTEEGLLTITPVTAEVVVKIVGNTDTMLYDGTEKAVEGCRIEISNPLYTTDDFEFTGNATATGTDADKYPMGLKADQFGNTSANFTSVKFIVTDGWLEITPRKVTLTSASDEKVYDGTPLTNPSVTISGDGFAEGEGASFQVTGSQLNVGESDNAFTYELLEGTLAKNYTIEKKCGTLKVTPVTDEIIVTITGHESSAQYDGAKHATAGYDVAISDELYTEDCFKFTGKDKVEAIHAGEYAMGLKADQFMNVSKNFTNVKFVIERDGRLAIEQRQLIIMAGSYEGDYDAEWHEVGYTAEGLAETDKITALEMKDHRILTPGELTADFLPETLKITHANGTDSTGDYIVEYAPGKLVVNTVIVKYRVQYYYDGVLFGGATEEGTGEVLTQITEYRDKPRDMMFDHVDNLPLTLGLDEEKNVIRVYYVHIPLTGYLGAHNVGDCIE